MKQSKRLLIIHMLSLCGLICILAFHFCLGTLPWDYSAARYLHGEVVAYEDSDEGLIIVIEAYCKEENVLKKLRLVEDTETTDEFMQMFTNRQLGLDVSGQGMYYSKDFDGIYDLLNIGIAVK